jgi:glycerol kinase
MTADVVLAIDQGTTGTTAMVMDRNLNVLGSVNREFRQFFPKPGWVEHDLEDIWASVLETIPAVLAKTSISPAQIAAIGITNQRETVGIWDRKTGKPAHNAIVWQCRRTTDACRALEGHAASIRAQTGLVLDPYPSATKLRWLLDHVDGLSARATAGEVVAGTIDTFLTWRLTGGVTHVTDVSNASRTLLFDIHQRRFSESLLELFGVPARVLPEVRSSAEIYGHTRNVPGLPDGIPISGMAGDQQAALFGQACFDVGDAKCTYGTGAFILMNLGNQIPEADPGLLTTVAWQLGPKGVTEYALEGPVFCAGAMVQWLRDGLGILTSSSEIEALARSVPNSGQLVVVPALTGLGAPHWKPDARGLIAGITRDTTRAHLARATLEGIALACQDVLDRMQDALGHLTEIKVDGGASANSLLLELQASLSGKTVVRPRWLETTAQGAALLAGLGVGLFPSKQAIREAWQADCRVAPDPERMGTEVLRQRWTQTLPFYHRR